MELQSVLLIVYFSAAYGYHFHVKSTFYELKRLCEYWSEVDLLYMHPECAEILPTTTTRLFTTTPQPVQMCPQKSILTQCWSDTMQCPAGSQLCTQIDSSECCKVIPRGTPVSLINAKLGYCPQIIRVIERRGAHMGCWLDSACPGIQKCCVEPDSLTGSTIRICRVPVGAI